MTAFIEINGQALAEIINNNLEEITIFFFILVGIAFINIIINEINHRKAMEEFKRDERIVNHYYKLLEQGKREEANKFHERYKNSFYY